MSVTYRVSFELDRKFLSCRNSLHKAGDIFRKKNDYAKFDNGLPISATEVEKIVDLLKPMNSDSYAEIDNEIAIITVLFSNALHCLWQL
ncbi:hypothetical protein TNCV_767311 [Trichonephila clavipes]|nr:hypothetical protein TNCV_1754611 [Trichonephila clavipes]GFW27851.1 hypothetical protein TNCV_767311 [Trichonephila clavipes]